MYVILLQVEIAIVSQMHLLLGEDLAGVQDVSYVGKLDIFELIVHNEHPSLQVLDQQRQSPQLVMQVEITEYLQQWIIDRQTIREQWLRLRETLKVHLFLCCSIQELQIHLFHLH